MKTEFKVNKGIIDSVIDKVDYEAFERNIPKAQFRLDTAIANSMLPYIPIKTGALRMNVVSRNAVLAGTGEVAVYTGTPYGRFLYYGVKMVDSVTGKGARRIPLKDGSTIFRFKKGAHLVPTNKPLKYSDPNAQPFWFDVAMQNYSEEWVKIVKEALLNG